MTPFSWLPRRSRRPSPAGAARRPAFVPRLDRLEDRTVPSVFTVTNTHDSGSGSLRAALGAAADGDTIRFDNGLKGHTITLTSGELDVTASVNIKGLGETKLTVSGGGSSRVFSISSGKTVDISDLTVTNGFAATGGGIDNAGTLVLAQVAVVGNRSSGGAGGGGILNEAGATLTLDHDTVSDNRAVTTVGFDVMGGGLLNLGTATISSSEFLRDKALGGASTTFFGGSIGGGIANSHGARLTVSDSTFADDEAVSGHLDAFFGAAGGAIENDAGVNLDVGSTVVITGSTFVNNSISGGDGCVTNGGGLDSQGFGCSMTVTNSLIEGNSSLGGKNGNGTSTFGEGLGGGVMNIYGVLTLTNCTVANNLAAGGTGSTATLANPPADSGQGGGLVNLGGTFYATDSRFVGNKAIGGSTTAGSGGIGDGGGIANWGEGLGVPQAFAYLTNCIISGNEARAGSGSASFPAAFAVGGGVDNSFSAVMSITNCRISDNAAIGANGAKGGVGGLAEGGGVVDGFSVLFGLTDTAALTITNSTITDNVALGGRGGFGADGGDGLGGGLGILSGASVTVTNSKIKDNAAIGGAGGHGGHDGKGFGGGVYNAGTFAADLLTVIKKNKASTMGDNEFGV